MCLYRQCLVVLALLLALGCARRPGGATEVQAGRGEPVHVAAILPLTGPEATFGRSVREGAELAQDQINAAGGLGGRPIALDFADDQSRRELVVSQAERIVQDPSVLVILGEVSSAWSMAIASVAQRAGVPMISPTATNPALTAAGDMIFRACFPDPFQGEAMARYARESLHYGRVALMVGSRSAYSQAVAERFQATFTSQGGQIVSVQQYTTGDGDFDAQLAEIQPLAPDALYIPGYYPDVGLIAVAARRLGLQAALLGADGWESELLLPIGGDAIVGGRFTTHFSPEDPSAATRAFVAAYTARSGHSPDSLAALGYDALGMIAAAVRAAGTPDRRAIRDALAGLRDYPGVTGTITMGERRDPIKPALILRVKESGFTYEATQKP